MPEVKRRDSKGRKLWTGESQNSDGRYVYKYLDNRGDRKAVYSWRLTESDAVPKGKRQDDSLREKEKLIQKQLTENINSEGADITVLDLVKKYVSQKRGVRYNTQRSYNSIINLVIKEEFGKLKINKVKLSDAKLWLIKLQEDGRGYSTIHAVRGVIKPAFQMAVDDDLIRKNPFEFQLTNLVVNDSVTRQAITREQEKQFLDFVKNDRHFCRYYEAINILFKTGLRISEFAGLTKDDIDLKNRIINVDHQLLKKNNMEYVIEGTKTGSGNRKIPMSDDVYECFKSILENRNRPKIEPMIDGKSGFLYLDKNGMPIVAMNWIKYFKSICKKYNNIHKLQMPKITPHICRHTFCTNMAKAGANPKFLQYIMGHSDIGITLNTYTHVNVDDVKDEVKKLCNW